MNLLIIEDDINLNEGLFYAFENDGFNVFKAYTKQEGLNRFYNLRLQSSRWRWI